MGFDKFAWIKAILADGQIPDGERLVLVGIAIWYVRYGEDEFCARQTTIAERMATSVKTVKRAMRRAKHVGYIVLAQPRQRGRGYYKADGHRLVLPDPGIGVNLTPINEEIGDTNDRNRGQDRQEKGSNSPEIGDRADPPTSENDTPKGVFKGLEKGGGKDAAVAAPHPPINLNGQQPAGPPPRYCGPHTPNGTPDPCHACAQARQNYEAWKTGNDEHSAERKAAIRAAINNCDQCDDYGRPYDGTSKHCPNHPNFRQLAELDNLPPARGSAVAVADTVCDVCAQNELITDEQIHRGTCDPCDHAATPQQRFAQRRIAAMVTGLAATKGLPT